MTEYQQMRINQDRGPAGALWTLINRGWSVESAIYYTKERYFFIRLSSDPWPAVTVPCGGCGIRMAARDLVFRPKKDGLGYCVVCNKNQ